MAARDSGGAESILPLCYGGSNGFLTQDYADAHPVPALRRVAPAAHGLRGADRRGQPRRSTARWPSVTYQDYPDAKLIIIWGVNPRRLGHPPDAVPQGGARQRAPRSS